MPNDFTESDIGNNKIPKHKIYLEDLQEAAYSPDYETFTNPGGGGVDLLLTVGAGYYAVVTHIAMRRAALSNDPIYIGITRSGEDPTATWHMVAVEELHSWVNNTPANALYAPGGNLLNTPLVLQEGDRLYSVSGGAQAAGACQGRYVLVKKQPGVNE